MAKRDKFHDAVRHGLEADGWIITHDPYVVKFGRQTLQVDLGAEMPIAAEKEGKKIAVEIKTFAGVTAMNDLYQAVGQYLIYKSLIRDQEADRVLYLAVPNDAYQENFYPSHGNKIREELNIHLVIYNPKEEEIAKWIE